MANSLERYRLQLDRCGRTRLVKQPKPLTGIEMPAELDELKKMHEEIDSDSSIRTAPALISAVRERI